MAVPLLPRLLPGKSGIAAPPPAVDLQAQGKLLCTPNPTLLHPCSWCSKSKAFFIAPRTGGYRFYTSFDDKIRLQGSWIVSVMQCLALCPWPQALMV